MLLCGYLRFLKIAIPCISKTCWNPCSISLHACCTVSVLLMSAFLLSFLNALPVVSMVAGLLPVSSILIKTLRLMG